MTSEDDTIQCLVSTFVSLRRSTDNVSLKLWCENGDFGFFLASTPAKHKAIKESEPVFNSNEEKTTELHQSSPKQARQTRKRKKVCSTQVSPELLRESSTNHVSDTSINITEISIPCQNNFQALSEAGEGSDDADEEVDKDADDAHDGKDEDCTKKAALAENTDFPRLPKNVNRLCEICEQTRVSMPFHRRCPECFEDFGI